MSEFRTLIWLPIEKHSQQYSCMKNQVCQYIFQVIGSQVDTDKYDINMQ